MRAHILRMKSCCLNQLWFPFGTLVMGQRAKGRASCWSRRWNWHSLSPTMLFGWNLLLMWCPPWNRLSHNMVCNFLPLSSISAHKYILQAVFLEVNNIFWWTLWGNLGMITSSHLGLRNKKTVSYFISASYWWQNNSKEHMFKLDFLGSNSDFTSFDLGHIIKQLCLRFLIYEVGIIAVSTLWDYNED